MSIDETGSPEKEATAKPKAKEPCDPPGQNDRKTVIKRLGTASFEKFRRVEEEEGRVGTVVPGSWSKMAIVRINRRKPKARCAHTSLQMLWRELVFARRLIART